VDCGGDQHFPGSSVPFGMVQYSPDTTNNYAGYSYDNPRSTGFSMTHASVGCAAFGDISMLPTTPQSDHSRGTPRKGSPTTTLSRARRLLHRAVPRHRGDRELSATTRTASAGSATHTTVRRPFSTYGPARPWRATPARASRSRRQHTITGWRPAADSAQEQHLHGVFAMKFSQPFTSYGAWTGTGSTPAPGPRLRLTAGVCGVPGRLRVRGADRNLLRRIDGARANLAAEAEGASKTSAPRTIRWNATLSHILVAGRNVDNLDTFYTSLYRHSCIQYLQRRRRTLYRIRRFIHAVAKGRTSTPLFRLGHLPKPGAITGNAFPKQASDYAQSLVNDAEQSGSYPRWALANSSTGEMSGDSVVPLIVNLYAYGARTSISKRHCATW